MKYDSKLEERLHRGVLSRCDYHSGKIDYTQTRAYEPDFTIYKNGNPVYIEAKGRFRTSDEARKYKDIRDALPSSSKLVFIFQDPTEPMPGARRKKSGGMLTHAGWAKLNGFDWYTEDTAYLIYQN